MISLANVQLEIYQEPRNNIGRTFTRNAQQTHTHIHTHTHTPTSVVDFAIDECKFIKKDFDVNVNSKIFFYLSLNTLFMNKENLVYNKD